MTMTTAINNSDHIQNKSLENSQRQLPPSVHVLPSTPQLKALLTIIRDKTTTRSDFIFYSDRIIRLLVEEGLNFLPLVEKTVVTPTGKEYKGVGFQGKICGIPIIRAGEAMEKGLRDICKGVRIGKILIQRNEETATPELYYAKLPPDVSSRFCLVLDPMLASGGSAIKAIEVLLSHGVKLENVVFLNLISAPEGINKVIEKFPGLRIVTAEVDECLNEKKFIIPGLGDFGCRYFGTDCD
ncbi:putative FUR1-uracil phosphoribosyltransferase [Paraphysoderma sedebokerense]|nr:putative FUR1-uracil phosphoribosyltransferase [Paraphysoderma sedebokerense]